MLYEQDYIYAFSDETKGFLKGYHITIEYSAKLNCDVRKPVTEFHSL